MEVTRRGILERAAALGLAATSLPLVSEAQAKEQLTVLDFSSPYVDTTKKLAANWDKADITWALEPGGAVAYLGKIKALWPNPPYDMIINWSPGFTSIMKEGWAETVTLADVPNLADVPEQFLTKDDKGNIKTIPRSVDGSYFAVRTDRCPIEIKTIEDLLNPKLKGQICWPVASLYLSAPTVTLALARGGNEFNLDPGWKFLEELAKSGNIGRVYTGNVEGFNSMTTGETSIIYASNGALSQLGQKIPIKPLTKLAPSLKAALYAEGWVVLASSKHKKAAMEFANFTVSAENSQRFHEIIHSVPANRKAKASADAAPIQFSPQELEKFAFLPDWGYMSTQIDAWVKKFEQDIVPKI
ncbi:extracellular solute-binding protein [Bradyrhizobium sp. 143]|uniref:ABC transporter substrate-binding protein n=1 Tax=Bradyrhizobium sp. 143 TaxID=2782619 RepID=UPI001FF7FBB0|nr:extracellular solute-binding protein [Bradyrhizobium sp. 143]MCK1709593.1 extracellular solute-binding protein [Bradyrhizobium sp. 143]